MIPVNIEDMEEQIRQSNLIEGVNDPREVSQSLHAWKFLLQQKELTHYAICMVQKIITKNQDNLQTEERGYYRRSPVFVGRDVKAAWGMIGSLMNNWVLDMKDYNRHEPKHMHVRFEKIHPFVDGNGRTGRMLMWWHELKMGREPTIIKNDSKSNYYQWFE